MSKDLFMEERQKEAASAESTSALSVNLNNLMNLNKAAITTVVSEVSNKVANGDLDAVKALIYAKKGLELLGSIEKSIRPYAEEQARVPKGGLKMYECELTEKVNGSKTDYSACEDPIYNELIEKLEQLKLEVKDREKFLSSISKPTNIVTDDGEAITINPPVRTGKLGLSISIK